MRATLVYIIDPDTQEVLMAKKVRKIGIGYWFGYGGKIEVRQTPEECIVEETFKESGDMIKLKSEKLERIALIDFFNGEHLNPSVDEPTFKVICYRIFQSKADLGGIPITTDEMKDPTWFRVTNLPLNDMKPGDELFVPQILTGALVRGWVHFSSDSKQVLGSDIKPCAVDDLAI